MNWIKSKKLRCIIQSKGYYESRRQKMIHIAWDYEQNAAWSHRERAASMNYSHWISLSNMYRKRAAWYVNKQIEAKYGAR